MLKSTYTGNSGERRRGATMFTLLLVPKLFFLHTWLVHLVWIKGVSLADIIGTDGLDEKMETYFDNKPKVGARFIT
jgi:hypothetical protein